MGADTARVTLFDGGDIVYGNNVKNESPSLDWINGGCAMAADVGVRGDEMVEGGARWRRVARSRRRAGWQRMAESWRTREQRGEREAVGLDVIVF